MENYLKKVLTFLKILHRIYVTESCGWWKRGTDYRMEWALESKPKQKSGRPGFFEVSAPEGRLR